MYDCRLERTLTFIYGFTRTESGLGMKNQQLSYLVIIELHMSRIKCKPALKVTLLIVKHYTNLTEMWVPEVNV